MRRFVITVIAALAVVLAVGGAVLAGTGRGSSVTRPRLERALPVAFANLYADQARMLGHKGVTPASLNATAMCDKGGAVEADIGPGSNWNCLVSWTDPNVPMPLEGYGKFEVSVHSNGCFTAGGPSKLVGFQTLTDTKGREVTNPVYEFDGCFDPDGDNTPTQVLFPSVLSITSTTVTPDAQGQVSLQLSCGTGAGGCAGRVTATAGDTTLGTQPIALQEETTAKLRFPTPLPEGASEVTYTVTTSTGVGPPKPVTLSVA